MEGAGDIAATAGRTKTKWPTPGETSVGQMKKLKKDNS